MVSHLCYAVFGHSALEGPFEQTIKGIVHITVQSAASVLEVTLIETSQLC